MRYDARVEVKMSLDVSWVEAKDQEALEKFLWSKLEDARILPFASVRDILSCEIIKCRSYNDKPIEGDYFTHDRSGQKFLMNDDGTVTKWIGR